jgi:hypothetical protein
MRIALQSGLLLGFFAAAAYGQAPFLQPPALKPPKMDYLNKEAWKHAFQDFFGKSKTRPVFYVIEESRPDVCAVRLLEVPLPKHMEFWMPQFAPPASEYPAVKAQLPAPACPKG